MKTPENNPNRKSKKTTKLDAPTQSVSPTPAAPTPITPEVKLIEIDDKMMNEIIEKASHNIKSEKIKRHINDQRDAEAIRSVIQEYFTSFILIGYSVDNKRLIVKSTNSDKDEDALLEELRYVCFKLSGG